MHVWCANLDPPASCIDRLGRVLTDDERDRADRFRLPRDRDRCVAARGVLRLILGRYLAREANGLRFRYGQYGKPHLTEEFGNSLRFNAAHSDGLALFAIASSREVGVDLERIDAGRASHGIAEQFFSPREAGALRALPAHAWLDTFFACWTRKEAYVKARGDGLSVPLTGFSVTLPPEEPAIVPGDGDERREAGRWSLQTLDAGPGWAAALAIEGHGWRPRLFRWPDA